MRGWLIYAATPVALAVAVLAIMFPLTTAIVLVAAGVVYGIIHVADGGSWFTDDYYGRR